MHKSKMPRQKHCSFRRDAIDRYVIGSINLATSIGGKQKSLNTVSLPPPVRQHYPAFSIHTYLVSSTCGYRLM